MTTRKANRYCPCGCRLASDNVGQLCSSCQRTHRERLAAPPALPEPLWSTDQLEDAFASQHMGQVFRAYRHHPFHSSQLGARVTQAMLGQWLGLSQAQVNRIEKGPAPKNLDTLAHWARTLGMPHALLWFKMPTMRRSNGPGLGDNPSDDQNSDTRPGLPSVCEDQVPTIDYRGMVDLGDTPSVYLGKVTVNSPIPGRIGWAEVENIRATTREVALSENLHGGGLSCEAGIGQLRWAGRLLDVSASADVRRSMFEAVGNLSSVVAFSAFDIADYRCADMCFHFALWCADQSGSWALRANTLAEMSRKAVYLGDVEEALSLIEFAQVRSDRVSETARAMMAVLRSRFLALSDRNGEALAELNRGDQHFENRNPADDPPWLVYYDASEHQGSAGRALIPIARKTNRIELATPRLEAAIRLQGAEYPRSRTFTRTRLASLIMTTGDPREAIPVARQALTEATSLRSSRVVDELRGLARAAEQHTRIGDVAELRHEIATLVTPGL